MDGRLLVPSVLRPFGEHLAAMVHARSDDTCVAVGDDAGVMAALLGRAARTCICACDDDTALREMREELTMLGLDHVVLTQARGDALPLDDGCAQVVTSLFALPLQPDPVASLREMLRVLDRERGRLAVAMWSEPSAVPHLGALGDAAPRAAHAYGAPEEAEELVRRAGGAQRVGVARIHDVVRFDGIAHWWAAVAVAAGAPDRLREEAARTLEPFTAADGTMRIPCEAVVLTTER